MKYILALEGGGTHTRAGLYDGTGNLLREVKGGPANPSAYGIHACVRTVASITRKLLGTIPPSDVSAYAAFAGAAEAAIQKNMAMEIGMRLRLQQVSVTSDLHALLHANADEKPGILVIAGTGASVLARNDKGDLLRSGGWGTLFGDEGSSYAISVAALRACARAIDKVAIGTALTERLPEEANLNSFNDFAAWSTCATKRDIAALTRVVAAVAEEGDEAARFCIEKEARQLAALTQTVRKQLKFSGDIRVFENGALFESCTLFRDTFRATDNYSCAMNHNLCTLRGHRAVYPLSSLKNTPPWAQTWNNSTSLADNAIPVTEQTSTPVFLDALSAQEIADAMHHADKEAVSAINDVLEDVTAAIEEAARSLCAGGRIIYTGAGTSGRLGVLDASECPPTFGVSPDRVVGIIAGGNRALRESVEGAEDSYSQGASDLEALQISAVDFVVGIAASGATPYMLGALKKARDTNAKTALITSNPAASAQVDILIAPDTGAEVLPGSTRLKAGTAAKLILNMISTGAMAQAGYVYQGRMVNMTPANEKLRERAQRIVAEISGSSREEASHRLDACNYHISEAIIMAKYNLSAEEAATRLQNHNGHLREALK